MTIEHRSDPTKSRGQYRTAGSGGGGGSVQRPDGALPRPRTVLPWVLGGVREEFVRHLALPTAVWAAERAQSYRYLAKMDTFPERWLLKAASEDPGRRRSGWT